MGEPAPPAGDEGTLDDRQLLARHRAGDADAFGELIGRYRTAVYGYLVRCGVDAAARDDVFQDAFLKIHAAAATYAPDRPLRPWIFSIVANTVRSHYRRARVRQLVFGASGGTPVADSVPDGHAILEARETAAWIDGAIRALPLPQREAVVLCCIEQVPQAEAAGILGVPVNTMKTNLRRARLALAQALARRTAKLRREVVS